MRVLRHGDDGPRGADGQTTPFGYLFDELRDRPDAHLAPDAAGHLRELGTAMAAAGPDAPRNSTIPAIYTYWGQFIDHDVTAGTDSDRPGIALTTPVPCSPDAVLAGLRNLRRPRLDLDSVYGDGPGGEDAGFYCGPYLRVGRVAQVGLEPIPPVGDDRRDLPRIATLLAEDVIALESLPAELRDDPFRDTLAYVGDLRNDSNLLVAQLHVAYLRFHNRVVDRIRAAPAAFGLADARDDAVFDLAQRLVRRHHQWLVLHDYLKRVTMPGTVELVLAERARHYRPLPGGEPWAPLEFAAAAFRFGHSMIRDSYDLNRNYGLGGATKSAIVERLFQYTGRGAVRLQADHGLSEPSPFGQRAAVLPRDMVWEADRLCDDSGRYEGRLARRIDTRLSMQLAQMPNKGLTVELEPAVRALLRQLPQRNLLRGLVLSLPTGQAVAEALELPALTPEELRDQGNTAIAAALEAGGFVERTPLWFYVLREAEVHADGNSLGHVGSRILAETIVGLLLADPASCLADDPPWDPSRGVTLADGGQIRSIRDFLSFTGIPA
jgi:hypothetical protein